MIKIFTTTLTLLLFVSSCGTTQKVGKHNQTQKLAKRSIASALPWSGVGMLVLVANPVSRSGETDSSPINLRTSEGRTSGKTLGHLSYAVIDINESRTIGNQLYFVFKGEAKEGENGDYTFDSNDEGLIIHKSRVFLVNGLQFFDGGVPVFSSAQEVKNFQQLDAAVSAGRTFETRFTSDETFELLNVQGGAINLRGSARDVQGWVHSDFICENTYSNCS